MKAKGHSLTCKANSLITYDTLRTGWDGVRVMAGHRLRVRSRDCHVRFPNFQLLPLSFLKLNSNKFFLLISKDYDLNLERQFLSSTNLTK